MVSTVFCATTCIDGKADTSRVSGPDNPKVGGLCAAWRKEHPVRKVFPARSAGHQMNLLQWISGIDVSAVPQRRGKCRSTRAGHKKAVHACRDLTCYPCSGTEVDQGLADITHSQQPSDCPLSPQLGLLTLLSRNTCKFRTMFPKRSSAASKIKM